MTGIDCARVPSIREMLSGGDLRSIGGVSDVLFVVERNPERLEELVRCLESGDPVVRSRAADALEKASGKRPGILAPYKATLLRLAAESAQQEVRWHVAQMLPRLPMTRTQLLESFSLLRSYLGDRSVIVQVCALQAMVELAIKDSSLRAPVRVLVEASCRTGAPALRARGRKLIRRLGEVRDGV